MFSVEHASSKCPAAMEEGKREEEEQQASCLVAKQAVEFPQVLASPLLPPRVTPAGTALEI